MSPIILELILFLKKNKDLWSLEDVVESDKKRKLRNKEIRAQEKIDESAALHVLIDSFDNMTI